VARRADVQDATLAAVMMLDIALLTAVLYYTGGPFNPFSFLYLVNIALAAVILPPAWSWALAALSVALFGALFFAHVPLPMDHAMGHDHPISLHVQGMWVAFGVAAAFIVYFIQRVRGALAERDAELGKVRSAAARHEKLASLATPGGGRGARARDAALDDRGRREGARARARRTMRPRRVDGRRRAPHPRASRALPRRSSCRWPPTPARARAKRSRPCRLATLLAARRRPRRPRARRARDRGARPRALVHVPPRALAASARAAC
jgi:hypothetical protein